MTDYYAADIEKPDIEWEWHEADQPQPAFLEIGTGYGVAGWGWFIDSEYGALYVSENALDDLISVLQVAREAKAGSSKAPRWEFEVRDDWTQPHEFHPALRMVDGEPFGVASDNPYCTECYVAASLPPGRYEIVRLPDED